MNRFEHYRVVLDDVPIHYIHRRGVGPDPMPLVLTHGWPWTFWDFAEVIDALGRSRRPRRRPGRRLRCRRPLAARLRLLGPLATHRCDRADYRRPVGAADARGPRLRAVRRPRGRLGRQRHGPARPRVPRAHDRRPPEPARADAGLVLLGAQRGGLRAGRGGLVREDAGADGLRSQPRGGAVARTPRRWPTR